MKHAPLNRIRRGALFLGVFLVVSVCLHNLSTDRPLLESIYWFVITVSSVGYGETTSQPPTVQLLSIIVIVGGMCAVAYTIGGFLQLMTEGEISRAMGVRRMIRDIEKMDNHVIICGFGRVGRMLADDLSRNAIPYVIVELETTKFSEEDQARHIVYKGNATEETDLLNVGVQRAHTLVSALPSDADNVFLTLTARNLNPEIRIIARGEHPATEKKLLQAGASEVVMPALIGAQRISHLILRPQMAALFDRVTDRSQLDVEFDELHIGIESPLVGMTVEEAETHRHHGLLVVAVRRESGEMVFNPEGSFQFESRDTLVVMGKRVDIVGFKERYDV